jgi:hypothetical protein
VTCNAPGAHAEQVAQGGVSLHLSTPLHLFGPPFHWLNGPYPLGGGGAAGVMGSTMNGPVADCRPDVQLVTCDGVA